MELFESKADELNKLMSSYQMEIDKLKKLQDSAKSELFQLQKENSQNAFDLKCLKKWQDELKKRDDKINYYTECKDYIVNHIKRCNAKAIQENYLLSEKYPKNNYFLPLDTFDFLKIMCVLPPVPENPIIHIPSDLREKRKSMTPAEKKRDRKNMADAWRNAYAMMLAQNIFDNLTMNETVSLAHYLKACELLDNPQDKNDWIRYKTYATVLESSSEYDAYECKNILSMVYDCNNNEYDGRCCHKKYAYQLEDFKYITLKTNYIVSYSRL